MSSPGRSPGTSSHAATDHGPDSVLKDETRVHTSGRYCGAPRDCWAGEWYGEETWEERPVVGALVPDFRGVAAACQRGLARRWQSVAEPLQRPDHPRGRPR